MPVFTVNTVFNTQLDLEIAPIGRRIVAYVIDFFVLSSYLLVVNFILSLGNGTGIFGSMYQNLADENLGLNILLVSVPMLLYSLIMEINMHGQTVGKRLMKMRVVSADGAHPTVGQFVLRWITKFFEWPFLFGVIIPSTEGVFFYAIITGCLGIIVVVIAAVTQKNQRLGDLLAGTAVINVNTNLKINDTIFRVVDTSNYKVSFPEVMKLSDRDINTIKNVLEQARTSKNYNNVDRIAAKICDVLNVQTSMYADTFLEVLLRDYNYLAAKD